ncbi:thiamine phosphate synthase [Flavihumibacter sp. ZG627]|uniref:thiamine phosphate synthase n=1 Tax=Flavihumibacter sp. ZG627 TaxID=1463156 RepID=UPI00057D7583|nr:thiamine phosphate synthase [Flavihumibacter sp. ZG627]KIC92084.1 thiamine-phosphate synthase [Flavihumibacter sp. ZG627]
MLDKIQYISQGATATQQLYNITEALTAGCKWIQLRFKQAADDELYTLAGKAKALCHSYGASFIINDHPHIAIAVDADGVHLGLDDMPVEEARRLIGANKIIGGTANTFDNILRRFEEGCNYIGVGPFRFTSTKEKLSPILGLSGYASLLTQMKQHNITLPVYAIGGIMAGDLPALIKTGIYGIAVSGCITNSGNRKELIKQFKASLYAETNHCSPAI